MSTKLSYDELLRETTRLKQLASDLDKYKIIFNQASDAIALLDLNGNFIEVNEEFCRRLGYSREEFFNMTPKAMNSPKYVATVKERMRQTFFT